MRSHGYVVVSIDPESDFPGVSATYGPFANYSDASTYADALAERNGVARGEHVQVSLCEDVDR